MYCELLNWHKGLQRGSGLRLSHSMHMGVISRRFQHLPDQLHYACAIQCPKRYVTDPLLAVSVCSPYLLFPDLGKHP